MFIFLRLILAHFRGDFPLQFNLIFKLKHEGILGVFLYSFILFASCALLSWPYLYIPTIWIFLLFIFITHLIQDTLKIKYSPPSCSFWPYVFDQLFHVGIISLIFFTPLANLKEPVLKTNFFTQLYLNDFFVLYCIVLIIATYNGYYLIRCFHDSFLDRARYNSTEKWYGMLERATIVSIFVSKMQKNE